MTDALIRQAFRYNVGVYFIDPAYTSFIAAVKYMKNRKGPVHTSAAHVIGRRGMGFKERVPKYLRKTVRRITINDNKWKSLYKIAKEVPKDFFYRKLPEYKTKKQFKAVVSEMKTDKPDNT